MHKKRQIILADFSFKEEPKLCPRTPYYWMTEEELLGISKYYYILEKDCFINFTVLIDSSPYTFECKIPAGFTYNLADIWGPLQWITYDKHSPYVKNASLVHDYMISRKKVLYDDLKFKEKGITPLEFKKITSEIFGYILIYNAVPYKKAKFMATVMDCYQTFRPAWYSLEKEGFTI